MYKFIFSLFLSFSVESVAHACATCGFVDDSNSYFLGMIIFMTSVPVIIVGSLVFYLRKHGKKNDSNE